MPSSFPYDIIAGGWQIVQKKIIPARNFFHHGHRFALPLRILKRPHISLGVKVISTKDSFTLSLWKDHLVVIIGFLYDRKRATPNGFSVISVLEKCRSIPD